MPAPGELLHVMREVARRPELGLSLRALARRAGWSPFHLHRAFRAVARETPRQYALRLLLERAAVRLAASNDSVLAIAVGTGFSGHEVFTRAFRRHFGVTPSAFRAAARRGVSGDTAPRGDGCAAGQRHQDTVRTSGPCLHLFRLSLEPRPATPTMPPLSISVRDTAPQPVLFVTRRVPREQIAGAIGESLGIVFPYGQRRGAAFAGQPYTRYVGMGPGLLTLEVGMPLVEAVSGEGEVQAGALPAGPCLVAVHGGSYDTLADTYVAMERWMQEHGRVPGGAPWEVYVTDPAEHPDPADWRTEVYWPLVQ